MISGSFNLDGALVYGRGTWKLNSSLFEEAGVYIKFKEFFEWLTFKKRGFVDVLECWD